MHRVRSGRLTGRSVVSLCAAMIISFVGLGLQPAHASTLNADSGSAVHHDTSRALRDIKPPVEIPSGWAWVAWLFGGRCLNLCQIWR